MGSSPPRAVYDACVLYPFQLRNLLVQLAVERLVEARWTDDIHDEWIRNVVGNPPGLPRERLEATRALMDRAVPLGRVTGYAPRVATITLPDPDDRHVVAAAIQAGAGVIVTWNVRDFPAAELRRHGLRRATPDAFLTDLHATEPALVAASVENARQNLTLSKVSWPAYLDGLQRQGLKRFVAALSRTA